MAEITASLVKDLREITGAGMMDCKKALAETDGDIDKAVEVLREKGLAKAAKKANRIAAEGVCATCISADGKLASIVEVNSETDFVAKNEKFVGFVNAVAAQAATTKASDIDAFLAEPWSLDTAKTVNEELASQIAVIGENLKIRRFEKIDSADGFVESYIHQGGSKAILVEMAASERNDAARECAKNVAMQVCAMSPKYVSKDEIGADFIENEKAILLEQIKNDPKDSQKPQNVIEGMIKGRLNKELAEICLNDQVYVKAEDGKQTVGQYVAQVAKANNMTLSIKRFVRFETGEGLEKKSENFAEEVAKQMGM
ncbi:MAG: elongation factor Ts [Lachnospiraceae bacterium]|nr:elongation factor Ts [Lachnospiraceae bacterium]MBP5248723.1 elongation factor Ts [Lachnospiraceae bacterium]